ncbi:MAG TPA: MATE family efflux transporter [Amphiplicatus sp.]|nr:MATE family efflux transporter [Amphiplicatus sp.]
MRDLTEGPIPNHILAMAGPIAVGLIVQTLYYIVDLYFVGQLGPEALAGVGAAGNAMFLVIGFTQILSVGTVALVSHAAGRKDQADATLIFNQSVSLAAVFGAATLLLAYGFSDAYLNSVGADEAMINEGRDYIFWIAPGMALQFALAVMGSALRGTGVVKPTMIVQLLSVLSNIILAPILIAGWGTGHPLGVAGAGLAPWRARPRSGLGRRQCR